MKVSGREIANIWGMDETSFSRKKKLGTEIKYKNLLQLEDKLGIKLTLWQDNKNISVKYFPEVFASCGNGTFELADDYTEIQMPKIFVKSSGKAEFYTMCHAKGNSMYPKISDGDFVICEHNPDLKIENGEMYIFCYNGQIYLKTLTQDINQIVVESENPEFKTQYIKNEDMNNINLIGHVICSGRNF